MSEIAQVLVKQSIHTRQFHDELKQAGYCNQYAFTLVEDFPDFVSGAYPPMSRFKRQLHTHSVELLARKVKLEMFTHILHRIERYPQMHTTLHEDFFSSFDANIWCVERDFGTIYAYKCEHVLVHFDAVNYRGPGKDSDWPMWSVYMQMRLTTEFTVLFCWPEQLHKSSVLDGLL